MPVRGGNNILAPIRGEPAQSVVERQIEAWQRDDRQGFGAEGSGRSQEGHGYFHRTATVDLVRQRPPAIGDDGPSDRLDQDAVLLRYLVRRSYENAAGSIGHVGFDACGNKPHDLVVEELPVTGVIFVPDHQVHRQPF